MTDILKGNVVAQSIKDDMTKRIEELGKKGKYPKLAIVRLGEDPSDVSYERSIIKNCDKLDIKWEVFQRETSMTSEELVALLEELNNDNEISGILVFRPLPKHIDDELIVNTISPLKDVDCMNPLNIGKIFEGDMDGFMPGTPKAAMEILKYNDIDLEGKNVVVVNRSLVVGKPLAMMLLEENATVTICHSRTKNLQEITKNADIVIPALGRPKHFGMEYFNENSIIIDVGVSMTDEGKLSGDIDFDAVSENVGAITPVPGGVGSVTTTILLNQVVLACEKLN